MRFINKKSIGLIILVILIYKYSGGMSFRISDKKSYKTFQEIDANFKIKRIHYKGQDVRFFKISSNNTQKTKRPLIIFVHGAPGGGDAFNIYLQDSTLISKYNMISVDRLGYGYSNYGKAEVSIGVQADMIYKIIKQEEYSKLIIVGHSYGGPIAARIAMNYPQEIDGVVMWAPAIDPKNEKMFWYAKVANWKIFFWLLPKALQVATKEKMAHISELEKMAHLWKDIEIPILHVHGNKDGIVPYINTTFSKNNISKEFLELITLDGKGHFFIWNDYDKVRTSLMTFVDST